ncbi:thioesterase domain-containing protein [Nonomuraea sp. NPDC050310]|uniref:thioesterase II family protein n=1 Tax=Nonomuraea sp. NPDC050310 TaxID=3154935 RepID=UPI003407E3D3
MSIATQPPLSTTVQLFCLPYAGGAAGAFRELRRVAGGRFEVVPIQLPGREERGDEPPEFSVSALADEIAPHTGRPYAIYGHSMGARLAFEVVRELRRRGLPLPERLLVGAAHPPDRRVPLAATTDLPDDAFIDQLVRRAGAQPELRDEPELRAWSLPILRADFRWIRAYRYLAEPPLDVPVVAFAGADDQEVGPGDLLGWARHTSAGFGLRTVAAGHLFLRDAPTELARLLAEELGAPTEDLGTRAGEVRVSAVPSPGVAICGVTPYASIVEALDPEEAGWIESAAEEERDRLAARVAAARQALGSATGVPPDRFAFTDPATRGAWRPVGDPALESWRVLVLPLPVRQGEAVLAVAAPYERILLRLDLAPGWAP